MSAKTTELKPCPFCGSGNVRYKEAEHAVVCARCKARGSIAPDEEMAIRMWDERAGELKPDSWEKLEEDLRRGADAESYPMCKYANGEDFLCSECRFLRGEGCCARVSKVFADILDRIRKLRSESR